MIMDDEESSSDSENMQIDSVTKGGDDADDR